MIKLKFTRFGNLGSHPQDYEKDSEYGPPTPKGFYAFPNGFKFDHYFLLGATMDPWNRSNKSAWLKDKNGKFFDYNFDDQPSQYDDEKPLPKELIAALKYNKIPIRNLFFMKLISKEKCYCYKELKIPENDLNAYTSSVCGLSTYIHQKEEEDEYDRLTKSEALRELEKIWINKISASGISKEEAENISSECYDSWIFRAFYLKRARIFSYTGDLWHRLGNYIPNNFPIIKRKGDWIKTDYETYCRIFENMLHKIKLEEISYLKRQNSFDKKKIGYILKSTLLKKNSPFNTDFLEVFIEKV